MSFKIAVVPDMQYLAANDTTKLSALFQWLVDNDVAQDIAVALQCGDFVNDPLVAAEWTAAQAALAIWTTDDSLPFLLTQGNHDGSRSSDVPSEAAWRTAFPATIYTARSWWAGGFYDANPENCYLTRTIDGTDYLFLSLQWALSDEVLAWAAGIIAANPTKDVIVLTHCISNLTGLEQVADPFAPLGGAYSVPADSQCGQQIWDAIKGYPNVRWILAGHLPPATQFQLTGTQGNLVNVCQFEIENDTAPLGLLTIDTANNRCDYETYDPVSDISYSTAQGKYFRAHYIATSTPWPDWNGYCLLEKGTGLSAGNWTAIKTRLQTVWGKANTSGQPYKRLHWRISVNASLNMLAIGQFDTHDLDVALHLLAVYASSQTGLTVAAMVTAFTGKLTVWNVGEGWQISGASALAYIVANAADWN